MQKMGGQDGKLTAQEFVNYFEQVLPKDQREFSQTVEQFLQVAQHVRHQKLNRQTSQRGSTPSPSTPTSELTQMPSPAMLARAEQERTAQVAERKGRLATIFELFDLDGSGEI